MAWLYIYNWLYRIIIRTYYIIDMGNFVENLGHGLKKGLSAMGTMKGVWDAGRTIYHGARMIAPYAAMLL